ncbi:MAG: choice-of-anchor D domain-containing protein [Verrucomicrobiaceae bacterium]|nr:choice-of-anchor D domain-containing protein [Verrucomicrobiaceae bacterium]
MNTPANHPNTPRRQVPALLLGLFALLIAALSIFFWMTGKGGETPSPRSAQISLPPGKPAPVAAGDAAASPAALTAIPQAAKKPGVLTTVFDEARQKIPQAGGGGAPKPVPLKLSTTLDAGDQYAAPGGTVRLLRQRGWLAVHHDPAVNGQELAKTLTSPSGPLKDHVMDKAAGKGVLLFRAGLSTTDAQTEAALAAARQLSAVRSVTPVFIREGEGLQLLPTDQLIVRLQQGVSPADVFGTSLQKTQPMPGTTDQHVVTLRGSGADKSLAAVNTAAGDPRVIWAEPNFLSEVRKNLVPNDTFFGQQWHLDNTGQGGGAADADSDVKEAWDQVTGSSNVVIAIIDDGVQTDHPDLAASIFVNTGEIPGNNIDDDNNGYVDDVNGWDFYGNGDLMDPNRADNDPNPQYADDSHGTACAGVAAAAGQNGTGVAGTAFGCKILPVKSGGDGFEIISDRAACVRYAAGLTTPQGWRGADVLSISLEWSQSTAIDSALTDASTLGRDGKGCAIFCAAGNEGGRWQKRTIQLTAGTKTFRWTYAKDSTTSNLPDTAWLDTIIWPDGTMEHFEGSSLPAGWTTGGSANWISVQEGIGGNHALVGWNGEGSRSIRAGTITHSQSSYVEVTKTVTAGPLTFYVWVDCEYSPYIDIYYDYLGFAINGVTQFKMDHPDGGTALPTEVAYPSSHPNTIAVGASSDFDFRSDYSRHGSALDLVCPSSGGRSGIYTTDRTGADGYVAGDYEPAFSGTSSATPMAAGIAALMLSANPNLSATNIRTLMRNTSDKVGGVTYTGGFNTYYGYGRANANAAVTAALAAAATNADLASLSSSTGTLVPGFASDTLSYALAVPNATTSITLTPTVAQTGATVTVNGGSVISGSASGPISLNVGDNTITIVVTATDLTTTKTYTVTATRAAPPMPEIVVEQPAGTGLTDGSDTLAFGVRLLGPPGMAKTVTIRNTGTADLTGLQLVKDGDHPGDFTLTTLAVTTLTPGGSTTFDVNFVPTADGSRIATLHILSNDGDEASFDIHLTGTGSSSLAFLDDFDPGIDTPLWATFGGTVTANTVGQAAGPGSTGNSLHFDGGGSRFATTVPLNLGPGTSLSFLLAQGGGVNPWETADAGDEVVVEYSTDGANFVMLGGPYNPRFWTNIILALPPAAQTAATQVRFRQLANAGSGTDHWAIDDVQIGTGFVTAPEIAILDHSSIDFVDGVSSYSFGNVNMGASSTARTFTIRNTGSGPLSGFPVTVDGANAGEFAVSGPAVSSLLPGSTTTFTITFTPTQPGARSAAIHVGNNDADEHPFDFTVEGTGVAQPPQIASAFATKVELDTATLNASVNPRGAATSVTFHWGLDTNYGSTAGPIDVGSGVTAATASFKLMGLSPNTTYNFKAVATSAEGTVESSNVTFTTGIAYYVNDGATTNDLWCTAIGNDANDGLTPATPKATVQAIISTYVLEPADVVRIDTGTYSLSTEIAVTSSDQGSTSAPVVFEASPYGVDMTRQVPSSSTYNAWNISGSNVTLRTAQSSALPGVGQRLMRIGWSGAGSGGMFAVYVQTSNAIISRVETLARTYGVYTFGTNTVVENCLVRGGGYGIYFDPSGTTSAKTVRNCTVTGFSNWGVFADGGGGFTCSNNIVVADGSGDYALYVSSASTSMVSSHNCLVARNGAYVGYYNSIAQTTLADWQAATGKDMASISLDPLFVDADGLDNVANNADDDLHLQSTAGSYKAGVFAADAADSPGVDAGDPAAAVAAEPAPNGGRVNLGAYGGTEQASKTPAGRQLLLVGPNGGEAVSGGSRIIHWNATGQGWTGGDTVGLEYSTDGGTTWQAIAGAGALDRTLGQFTWDTSALASGGYRVRVNYGGTLTDASDSTFVIRSPAMIYYVNEGSTTNDLWCTAIGDDANDGLTPATPKASVQAILSGYDLEPGDVVRIDTGSYTLSTDIAVSVADEGGLGNPVVFEASPYGVDMTRQVPSSSTYNAWNISGSNVTLRTAQSSALPGVGQRLMRIGWSGAGSGGMYGLYVQSSASNCTISRVDTLARSYGVYAFGVNTVVENCLVRGGGYGIYFDPSGTTSAKTARNCTVIGFSSWGIYSDGGGGFTCSNNIVIADGAGDYAIYVGITSASMISDYNCLIARNGASVGYYNSIAQVTLADWQAATGKDAASISLDPLFVDENGVDDIANNADDDLHLQSTAGSYKAGAFTADTADSPALDAGDPSTAVADEPAPNGGRINLGAYGGTEQASKTPAGRQLLLVGPNGGEAISGGTRTIYWNATGQGWMGGDTLALEYSIDGGTTWQVIPGAGALDYALGQYVWNTSSLPGGGYRVRVNYGGGTLTDASDAAFVIRSPSMIYYVNDGATTNDLWCIAIGDDANDGLTPATPKASVQAILSSYDLEPGDTVRIDTGSYDLSTSIAVTSSDGGGSGTPVVFDASPRGVTMVRQVPTSSTVSAWSISTANVTLRTDPAALPPGASHEPLRLAWSGAGSGEMYAVHVQSSASNCTISRVETLARTYGVYGSGSNVIVENCILRGGHTGAYFPEFNSNTKVLRNCTIAGFSSRGVYSQYGSGLSLINNIIVADGSGDFAIFLSSNNVTTSNYNCLVARNGAFIGNWTGNSSTLSAWQTATGKDANSISTEPAFVDENGLDDIANNADDDLHLASTSPCVNVGDNSAVGVGALDMDGQSRILLTTVDIGADEYADAPEIVVELVSGTPLLDGVSTAAFGFAGIGVVPSPSKTFTIRNIGIVDLTGLALSVDGPHAAQFVPGAFGTTTVPPGGSTTFVLTFVPAGVSTACSAVLHIENNDVDENSFDILLTGTALSQTIDSDGDGMKDWGEGQLAAMGFDWQVDNTTLVDSYFAAANSNGLFTASQVQAMNIGTPLLQRNPATGVFTLTLGIGKSTTLQPGSFVPFPFTPQGTTINGQGKIEFQFTVPDDAAFFQLQGQ